MIKFETIHYQVVTSTNTVLKDLYRDARAGEGTVILADFQTEGKGRGENSWYADPGINLLVSILFEPDCEATSHFMLNEFVSLSIIEALLKFDVTAQIKWPNDIYLQGKKLAGILIENIIVRGRIRSSVVGIGLNLNQQNFPSDIPNPISLNQQRSVPVERTEFLNHLLDRLKLRYKQLLGAKFQELHSNYLENVYMLGKQVSYKLNEEIKVGHLTDIRPKGEIVIEDEQGEMHEYLFGEISLVS